MTLLAEPSRSPAYWARPCYLMVLVEGCNPSPTHSTAMNAGNFKTPCMDVHKLKSTYMQSVYSSNREAASGSLPSLFEFFGIAGEKIAPWKDE
ncbi:hypothetical protein F2Q69_00005574 [Brassica cretica]|uniref:Uncharacterized protein n=1 Tax=Brassica cretica TaxID=69181 RepID=A0A8S9P4Q5_BRACR|nr:hypothetical protein F2Q69_00005574 [Brassica cretica]